MSTAKINYTLLIFFKGICCYYNDIQQLNTAMENYDHNLTSTNHCLTMLLKPCFNSTAFLYACISCCSEGEAFKMHTAASVFLLVFNTPNYASICWSYRIDQKKKTNGISAQYSTKNTLHIVRILNDMGSTKISWEIPETEDLGKDMAAGSYSNNSVVSPDTFRSPQQQI